MTDHQRHAGPARHVDNLAALFDRRRDRLFHHHVNAACDTGQRDIPMKVGWRSNRYRVDVALKQFIDV